MSLTVTQDHRNYLYLIGHKSLPSYYCSVVTTTPFGTVSKIIQKTGYVTLTMPLRGSLLSQGYHLMYSTCTQNLTTVTSVVPGVPLCTLTLKMGHVTVYVTLRSSIFSKR